MAFRAATAGRCFYSFGLYKLPTSQHSTLASRRTPWSLLLGSSKEHIASSASLGYPPSESTLREIEPTLKAATPPRGHRYWGFTIYRCTYTDDTAWSQLMAFLEADTRESLQRYDAEELMDSLRLDVREEPEVLDGASKAVVRKMFKQCIASPEAESERDGIDGQPILIDSIGTTPRYRYCIHIDEAALRSIIDSLANASNPWARLDAYVNLIDASWELEDPVERAEAYELDPEVYDLYDEGEEPLEGCRLYDVGWMRMNAVGLMPGVYGMLHWVDWEVNYKRPPAVAVY